MVWEFIDGENLAQRLRTRGTLPARQAVRIIIQALRGLEAIHRAGIIHRDISPENLMITKHDEVKIIDLGVAKVEDTEAVSQTRTGIFVGKLRYAAPEQLGFLPEGERIDGRTDLYATAMVLVELLTGRPPYEAKSPHEYFLHHARELPTTTVELPAALPGSEALRDVLQKALSRDRNERFATAHDFALALEAIERTLPDPREMATMATPFDADETLKVGGGAIDHVTVRTPAPGVPTEPMSSPSLPVGATAAATLQTPLPAAMPPVVPPVAPPAKRRAGINPVIVIALIAFILVAAGAFALWPKLTQIISPADATEAPTTPATVATTVTTTAQQATSTVDVTPPPAIVETTTTAAPPPALTQTVAESRPPQNEEPTPQDDVDRYEAPAMRLPAIYVEGPGRAGANERALARLSRDLRGVNQIAVRAGGATVEIRRAFRRYIPHVEFVDQADVVIRFNATSERLGRQGRHLAAGAVIEKNGRVIFRYELPNYVDRGVAAEAFVQTIAEAWAE
jgi:serine/threonine-protein kinase